eukprot:14697777-Alexandrium_andersonii.AAC.1
MSSCSTRLGAVPRGAWPMSEHGLFDLELGLDCQLNAVSETGILRGRGPGERPALGRGGWRPG